MPSKKPSICDMDKSARSIFYWAFCVKTKGMPVACCANWGYDLAMYSIGSSGLAPYDDVLR